MPDNLYCVSCFKLKIRFFCSHDFGFPTECVALEGSPFGHGVSIQSCGISTLGAPRNSQGHTMEERHQRRHHFLGSVLGEMPPPLVTPDHDRQSIELGFNQNVLQFAICSHMFCGTKKTQRNPTVIVFAFFSSFFGAESVWVFVAPRTRGTSPLCASPTTSRMLSSLVGWKFVPG